MTRAFISYSHADDALRAEFDKHLSLLRRQGLIDLWSDQRIPAGGELVPQISAELEAADIIILLISPDFMASDYCYGIEMKRAMQRHHDGTTVVIPIILRPVDWHTAPFGALKAVPRDGKPVTKWLTLDDAFLDVVQALRSLLAPRSTSTTQTTASPSPASMAPGGAVIAPSRPRSGALSLAREFNDIDRDGFLDEAFAYIRTYFDNSLQALGERNPGIASRMHRISHAGFTVTLYRDGSKQAGCYIRVSDGFGRDRSIRYSNDDSAHDSSYNEMLSLEADRHTLCLTPMTRSWSGSASKLTHEGAAEHLWQLFIERLT